MLRVKVGDTVRVTLVNPETNKLPHSIDFHASMVAWNDEMRSINPGEELVYEFVAKYAGVYMYHCGTTPGPASHRAGHVRDDHRRARGRPCRRSSTSSHSCRASGTSVEQAGFIEPRGGIGRGAGAGLRWCGTGIVNQYADHPIQVPVGEEVRVFVLNAGPSIDSSFHVVGTIFHEVIKEGVHLTEGNEGNWGSQAVDLAPAQGAIVEMRFDEDGMYPIVTHAFNFVGTRRARPVPGR